METKKNNEVILSVAYMPNVQYFTKLLHEKVIIEQHENYLKQTFRNRCEILAANGIISLTVPVKRAASKIKIRDVKIDYTDDWQKNHWRTIVSAYRSSPFFEYYTDDFLPFYEKKEVFLFDFNLNLLYKLIELTGMKVDIMLSDTYLHEYENDCRTTITPGKRSEFSTAPYYQVFGDKFGFQPNLSILDLLANEGNNSFNFFTT
jgi:hypothetical protein